MKIFRKRICVGQLVYLTCLVDSDPDYQRSRVTFPPRTNNCVMNVIICSMSGYNYRVGDIFTYVLAYIYINISISSLVPIVQALLLGSDIINMINP